MIRKASNGVIIVVALILLIFLLVDIWSMFGQTREQTKDSGIYQLENISGKLESTISDAESLTLETAIPAGELLEDREALKKYIYEKKTDVVKHDTGVYNVYIAGKDWFIIPDFDAPKDYIAQERLWYKGAIRNRGKPYVSSPYQDAATGEICFSVSVMLGDGETVLAMDYTMDTIQRYITEAYEKGSSQAVIVTEDGTIAGSSKEDQIGKQLVNELPEYVGIWSLSKKREGVVTTRIREGLLYDNFLVAESGGGWYMIVSVSDWVLFRSLYLQFIITILLAITLFGSGFLLYLFSRKYNVQKSKLRKERRKRKARRHGEVNKQYRNRILVFMVVIMLFSLYTNVYATYKWGTVQLKSEAEKYEYQLAEWVDEQKTILDMFVSGISTNPDRLNHYKSTVAYLNRITEQYPEISVTYIASPDLKPTVYMNNGWKPPEGWDVEERPWYIGAMNSDTGWNITAPYYDDQTGGYCVTFSEKVYDARTGLFLGVFGIDFYMDKLVSILGDSYSDKSYAFLVDTEGKIINHPYGSYQMTQDNQVSVLELPYGDVKPNGKDTKIIRDYDGELKTVLALENEDSHASIYIVYDLWSIYGRVFFFGLVCLMAFLVCIIQIYRLLSRMIQWQDEVNRRLRKAAQTDAMTGLLNKASAEEALANAVKEGEGALLIIDLDSFKLVNDLYGHDIGDKILIRFSELIRSVTRDSDVTGRIGGDEFAVYCDGMTSEKAIQEKCIYLNREILKTAREYMGNDMDIPLGCSVGAVFVPQGGREYGTLFSKADMALHRAKKDGKHDCSIFRDEAEMTQEERSDDIFSLKMIFGERNRNRSAIIADKDMFRDIYRFLVRFSVRSAWTPRLVVFTLQGSESAAISACTDQFMEISAKHLRSCDVLLKYNASQVIILLTGAREEDFDIPIDRLMKAWEKEGVDQIQVTYQLESKIG